MCCLLWAQANWKACVLIELTQCTVVVGPFGHWDWILEHLGVELGAGSGGFACRLFAGGVMGRLCPA